LADLPTDAPVAEQDLAVAAVPPLQLQPWILQQAGGDLNFDLLGEKKDEGPTPEQLELSHRANVRRTYLTVHQTVGFSTLGLLAATVVVGQLNYMDQWHTNGNGVPAETGKWELTHEVLSFTTLGGFLATGLIGLLTPVTEDAPRAIDTTFFHKLFMGGAALGMTTEMALGIFTEGNVGLQNQKSLAQIHQVIGYSTLGLMTMGVSAFLF
jgi:hypothetical protein